MIAPMEPCDPGCPGYAIVGGAPVPCGCCWLGEVLTPTSGYYAAVVPRCGRCENPCETPGDAVCEACRVNGC